MLLATGIFVLVVVLVLRRSRVADPADSGGLGNLLGLG
jgi:hypothetical protein